jgi:hypothetical protein
VIAGATKLGVIDSVGLARLARLDVHLIWCSMIPARVAISAMHRVRSSPMW